MRTNTAWLTLAMALVMGLGMRVSGAVTNDVPWTESFEGYVAGTDILGSNGWSSGTPGAGVVTNDAGRADALTNYTVGGRSYPLPGASHTNILQVTAEVVNALRGSTGGVVQVDLMAWPSWSDSLPLGQTNDQCAFFVGTNGLLNIWHQDRSVVPATNTWQELTNSPTIGSNGWARFSVIQDYSNRMFQVCVNEGSPLVDGRGWSYGGAAQGGSWFYMVQSNASIAAFVTEASPAYVDDVVARPRSLAWSGSNLTESVTNNGAIDNSSPISISLVRDTFAASAGDDLVAAGKMVVSGLPSNLVAVATVVSSTNVALTVTNRASLHESANTVSNLVVRFLDTAFVLSRAWDVSGSSQTNVLAFRDTPSLGYGALSFSEASANDGSIDNGTPLVMTLTNGTFNGVVGEDFATNSLKVQLQNLPAGLTGHVVVASATQVQVTLTGAAGSHAAANSVANLQVVWQAGALSLAGTPLSSVFNLSTNLSISFSNPGTLSYGTSTFSETVANAGAVSGTTLTLANKSFNASLGQDMVALGLITVANLPAGMGIQIVRGVTAQTATLSFTGAAGSHAAANSIANLTITLTEAAVVGGNVAAVSGYSRNNLAINFDDPRTLVYSGTSFSEVSGGLIDNRHPVTITLSGDTLTGANGDDFVAAAKIAVANLPAGLTAQILRSSATQLAVSLVGTATSHASGDSVADIVFTFANGAFTAGNAVYVGGYQTSGIAVVFNDQSFYNVLPFEESFEQYASGVRVSSSNGWSADYSVDAGIATNTAALLAGLATYVTPLGRSFPVSATHTQTLFVQDFIGNAVHSEGVTNVFVDFLAIPVAIVESPSSDTNDQFACYVTTNGSLVVWHRNVTTATNEWIALSNAPGISTSDWVRLTVESDYVNNMFQVRVNEGQPVSDPHGWTHAGGSPTGTWFHMVQTNGSMTTFKMTGSGAAFLDDFTVRAALPDAFGRVLSGSIYLYR